MKVTAKTREELLKEGWQVGCFTNGNGRTDYGLFYPHKKAPMYSISMYQTQNILGKEGEVIDYKLEDDSPRFRVVFEGYTTWVTWAVLKGDLGIKNKRIQLKVLQLPKGKVKIINENFFDFDCSMSEMNRDQVRKTIKKLAPVVGLRVSDG